MQTLHATQASTQRTPSSREADRSYYSAAVDEYLRGGRQIESLPGFECRPRPARRDRIDPDTVLCRRRQSRREAALDARALPLIQKHRLEPLRILRQILRDEGVNITPRRIELIAVRHGIVISAARA